MLVRRFTPSYCFHATIYRFRSVATVDLKTISHIVISFLLSTAERRPYINNSLIKNSEALTPGPTVGCIVTR